MVRLKRKKKNEDFIADVQPPQKAVMYYNMRPVKENTSEKEYQFYFIIYDKNRTIEDILDKQSRPDKVFKATSQHSVKTVMQGSDFITDKDFGIINKLKGRDTQVLIGYILEPDYSTDRDKWDYAEVFIDMKNSLKVKWRH